MRTMHGLAVLALAAAAAASAGAAPAGAEARPSAHAVEIDQAPVGGGLGVAVTCTGVPAGTTCRLSVAVRERRPGARTARMIATATTSVRADEERLAPVRPRATPPVGRQVVVVVRGRDGTAVPRTAVTLAVRPRHTTPAVPRHGRPELAPTHAVGAPGSRRVRVFAELPSGCPYQVRLTALHERDHEVAVTFDRLDVSAPDTFCTQSVRPVCLAVTLHRALGRRAVVAISDGRRSRLRSRPAQAIPGPEPDHCVSIAPGSGGVRI